MDIANILAESLRGFFADEFDEYNLEEVVRKIEQDAGFAERLKEEMLDILDDYWEG